MARPATGLWFRYYVLGDSRPSDIQVVLRGIAQTAVEGMDSDGIRDARIRDAVRELVKRIPSKKK